MNEKPSESPAAPLNTTDMPPFCRAMDAVPAIMWASETGGERIWFNQAWLEFTGRDPQQELGGGWMDGVHPDDSEQCRQAHADRMVARERFRLHYRLRRADGGYRWIEENGAPHYSEDGRYLGYIGVCTDIHDQKEAEGELRKFRDGLDVRIGEHRNKLKGEIAARNTAERGLLESSAQLDILVQGVKDCAIYMLDTQGHVSSWNSGAKRIKGYVEAEIIGRHFSCFYTPEDQAAGIPARALRKAAEEGKFEAEGWRVRKNGERFWASVLIDPIYAQDGGLIGFAKVTRDATERRMAQEQLERAQESLRQAQKMEAIGQLTGGVAHDFNNLLMVIMGNLEIAERQTESEAPSVSRMKRALANAMQGARRAATLTQRLLAFSRRQPLAPRVLDLNKFIAGEVEFLQRTLGENIEVQAVGGAGLWKVEVDGNQLEAALLNLAVNARDAMPDGGKLTIETSNAYVDEEYARIHPEIKKGQYVLLSVTDSGTGMTQEVLAQAFEPFFSTKVAGHGTGLGLSQVYGFIRQSNGYVTLYSEPGEGTTVKIYLPRSEAEDVTSQAEAAEEPARGDRLETILLVEDDEDVRAYLIELLQELQYRVLPAHDSVSAFEFMEAPAAEIDLLLTDVILPGMNGRELARKALALRPGLKVLFMTGYSRNAIVHQGRLDADVELVQKPVTQRQLAARIRALLDR